MEIGDCTSQVSMGRGAKAAGQVCEWIKEDLLRSVGVSLSAVPWVSGHNASAFRAESNRARIAKAAAAGMPLHGMGRHR